MSGLHELGCSSTSPAIRLAPSACFASPWPGQRIPGPSRAKIISLRQHAQLVAQFDHAPARAEPLLRRRSPWRARSTRAITRTPRSASAALSENLRLRKLPEAETSAREAAAMLLRLYGPGHVETLSARLDLASGAERRQQVREAERSWGTRWATRARSSATDTPRPS
jgi:hypothetical protein